jgi:peptidyl-prolyl cis-trans isomerase B (cyclophilin B)
MVLAAPAASAIDCPTPLGSPAVSKQSKRDRQRQNREARREYETQLARRRRTWKTVRTFAIIAAPILVIGIILSVTSGGGDDSKASGSEPTCTKVDAPPKKDTSFPTPPALAIDPNQSYSATLDTTCGPIDITLFAQQYPTSANNFVFLAEQGFYDNLAVVRAAKGFVVQAGSPTQSADGGPGYSVQGEVPATPKAYPTGTVAWAKTGTDPPGTIGSQFFIVTGDASQLPPDYAVLGTVTKGLKVAKSIEKLAPSTGDGPPTRPVVIKKVTVAGNALVPTSTLASTPPSS